MAEKSQWYYVENQERKGPVTESALKQLVSQGVITENTLVWKEGMKDWEPAQTIKGLVESKADELPKVKVAGAPASTPRPQRPAATPITTPDQSKTPTPSSTTGPTVAATNRPTAVPIANNPPTNTPAGPVEEAPTMDVAIRTEGSGPRGSYQSNRGNLFQRFQFVGYPCLVAGFLLVIGAKGCDSLGNRWASRLSANSQMAEDKFDYRYMQQINSLQVRIDDLNASDDPNREKISELNKQISDLNSDRTKERQRLMKTTWFKLNAAAKTARANNQAWGFYRELGFVFGSMVLSVGLLVLGITGTTSEQWTCLIMLAIITFSIYIGGFAWFSSIAGNVPSGMGL